jgi:PEGA domain
LSSGRLPNGWIVLGGSVLASFVWWMVARPSNRVAPAPATVAAPAPVETAPEVTTSAKPAAPSAPRASQETPEAPAEPAPAPEAPAAVPMLRVTGDVAGADVFVDRTYVGKTPFETRDITPGGHQINVSKEGFDGVSQHVDVASHGPTDMTFSLKAVVLDSAVQVVHKHRLGSCEGRLSADLEGLRYAPTSGDDAFHAPLEGMQTLAVDYQEKVLRLKLKSGKSFTFTTRAANADPLLTFHRDVETARKKLAGGA